MQRSLFFIKQNSIKARIIHVSRANLNRRQAAAVTEGPSPDTGDAVRNGDARQAGAALEGQKSDAGDAIRNRDARQASTEVEGHLPNTGNAGRNGDARQPGAETESSIPNAGDAIRDRDARQAGAVFEGKVRDAGDTDRDRDPCQVAAIFEGQPHDPRNWIASNRIGDDQISGCSLITIGDGNLATGWAINPEFGKPATAIYKLAKPLALKPSASLEFSIIQTYGGGRTIGRPRLSAMNGDPGAINLPDNIAAILKKTKRSRQESKQLTEYFQKENPQLKAAETELAATNKKITAIKPPTTLVMVEEDKPRETFIMQRGEYLNPGAKVTATTPEILHGMSADLPRNRLGFAKWLVAPQNPLLSRVTVNRWWAEIMGRGIVSTEEDFGTQSEPPTHPALLDWLSVEFIERGWSMRRIHKLIVMSATYRQSSRVTPAAQAADAPNKWHVRAPRLRMSAEMVRDNALTISGLLSTKMHGPPVYPPQPGGIWRHVGRNAPKYVAATDEDRFRRGVYVVWRRGAPYVSFTNFDAPDRGACVVRRPRTNTPLQALTLLNDEAYVEMAMAFAHRIIEINEATVDSRIQFAYRSALSREARAAEINYLKPLLTQRLAYFQKNPKAAADLVNNVKGWKAPQGAAPAELAAWFYLANILLNLDETITKS